MEHRELDIKNAYNKLLEFELELQKQESLRENLGSPFGRAPPFKLNINSSMTKLASPNYASGIARHPFLSTFTSEEIWSGSKSVASLKLPTSVKRTRLPKIVKVVNHTFQPSEALKTQLSLRKALKEELLNKFPSRVSNYVDSILAKEETYESLFEVPSAKPEFNPFLRPNGKNYFFPLEMFYDEDLELNKIIYPQPGFCQYNCGDSYEWRPCKVLKHIFETGKFFIQWELNGEKGEIKETSRHTVRFAFEDEKEFTSKIELAKQFRVNYEAGIRYLARLEIETFKNLNQISISDYQQSQILSKIHKDINEFSHQDICEEIRNNYVRGVVEFTFKIQHFLGEAKRLEKPWEIDLVSVEKMQCKTKDFRHRDMGRVCKKLEKELLLNTDDFAIVRQAIHNLSEISSVRIYKVIFDLAHKKSVHEEKKLKWIIKDWYTEVKLKVDKFVKGSIRILKQSEASLDKQFFMSQVMFESNLQVCIKKSTDELIDHFNLYYSVLPFHEFDTEVFKSLSLDTLKRRQKARTKLHLYKDHDLNYYIEKRIKEGKDLEDSHEAILESLGKFLLKQIFSFNYVNYDSPAPFMILSIISRFSLSRQLRGRKFKLFTIAKAFELKKDTIFSTSLRKVAAGMYRETEILKTLEHPVRLSKKERKKALLVDSNISWLKADYNQGGLFLTPDLRYVEESLRDILKAPIKSFEKIKSISKQKMLDEKLKIPYSAECYSEVLEELTKIIKLSLLGPCAMLKALGKFEYLVKDSPSKILEEIMSSTSNNYKDLHLTMKKIKRDFEEIENLLPSTMNFGLFQLDLHMIKSEIINNSKELLLAILEEIEKEKHRLIEEAHQKFKLLISKLISPPTDVEEFVEIRDYLDRKGDIEDFRPIKSSLHVIELISGIMDEFHFAKMTNSEEKYWQTISWPKQLAESQELAKKTIEKLYPHFRIKITESTELLSQNINKIVEEIKAFSGYSNLDEAQEYAGKAKDIADNLKKFQKESKQINSREAILKFERSDFSKIDKLIDSFDKYEKLWEFIYDWNCKSYDWTNQSFKVIDPKLVEETLRYGFKLLSMIEVNCGNDSVLMSIALVMHSKLNLFEKFLPVIFCLRIDSIELRHWKEIWKILKENVPSNVEREKMERQSLQNLLDKDILNKLAPISEVATRARHEAEVDKTLKKIKSDLSMQVQVVTYENFDRIELVKDISGLIDMVKEHILILQFLQKNVKYIDHCKFAIEEERVKAIKIESFLEDLSKFQQNFKELYPLFLLPEIFDDLKAETNKIKEAQNFLEKKIEMIKLDISNYSSTDDFKNLFDMNENLDEIRKTVKQNLEKKQNNCSRLCFLGYESLVIFLTELAKRKSLKISQLFPGLEFIDISENNIHSARRPGYVMHLSRPVTLFLVNKPLTLDTWVIDLEIVLVQTFKDRLQKLLESEDLDWKQEKDLQILILGQMIRFSKQINNPNIYEMTLNTHLSLIDSIKTGEIQLEKLSVLLLSQLNTLEKVKKDPLDWEFTLKYETEPDLHLKILHYSLAYSYEFHQMEEKSFIPTPISDKLMLHIVNAFTAHQPVLLTGSGGSGKTCVIREIALMCGKGICFWTSVKGISLDTLFSAISGCASGGFWAVIEEIQNTETQILSSLLYYMKEIVKGLKGKQNRVHIFDKFYKIKEGFSVFFTISGKVAVPDYLTQNLRSLQVIKPDFGVLVRSKLQALGFDLGYSEQISLTFKLISENFESIVGENRQASLAKSLNYLNRLISLLPRNLNESLIVEAFQKLFVSEVAACERKILTEILESVFPNSTIEPLSSLGQDVFIEPGYAESQELKQQINILLEMTQTQYKWIFVTGSPCSGKSALLSFAAREQSKRTGLGFLLHKLQDLNSNVLLKLISLCELFDENNTSYCSYSINEAKFPSPNDWIVIDAPLPLEWDTLNYISRGELYLNASRRVTVPKTLKFFVECENLNTFTPADLRNYGIVTLSESAITAEQIFLTKVGRLKDPEILAIFSQLYSSLVQAVYFSLSHTYFNYSLKIWILQLWRILDKLIKEAKSHLSRKYDSIYTQISKKKKTEDKKKLLGASTLADSIIIRESYNPLEVDKKTEIIMNTIEFLNLSRNPPPINTKSMYESIFLYAVIYTFGACERDKQKFHKVIIDFLSRQPDGFANGVRDKIRVKSVFDICYLIENQQWAEWGQELMSTSRSKITRKLTLRKSTKALIEAAKFVDSIYIQTKDTLRQVYWLNYFFNSSIPGLMLGQHQSGKSLLTSVVLKKFLSKAGASYIPISLSSHSTVSSVKTLISVSLDQIKKFYHALVGGIKHYIYIDDLNLDTSNSIYELFRYWKENHGWYETDFKYIGGTELIAVHGFTGNRPLYSRALRHFNILYKDPYTPNEIKTIFRSIIDSDNISMSQSENGELSSTDLLVQFYSKLYQKLSNINTEQHGYNFSFTTFIMALRKITELEPLENLENEDFLKVFTTIFKLYIGGQIDKDFIEVSEVVQATFSVFISEKLGETLDEKKIEAYSLLVDQSLFTNSPPEFDLLNSEILLKIIEKFDKDVETSRIKHFEDLKNLRYVYDSPEETLGKYILIYLKIIFELSDRKSCSIVVTEKNTELIKSLSFVAACTLQVPIFNFTLKDSRFKDFSAVSESYLPIEAKFMIREILFRSGLKNLPAIVMIEIKELFNCSYTLKILEIFNDFLIGGAIKHGASYKYYREMIEKVKRSGSEFNSIENEQVMVTIIERIKNNVKVFMIVSDGFTKFSRFKKENTLEILKHRYRSLFNCSKILNFDFVAAPSFVIEGIIIQETVLEKWLRTSHRALFIEFFKQYSQITSQVYNHQDLEQISFLAQEILVKNEKRLLKSIKNLESASRRVLEIETEISNFTKKEQSIDQELKKFKEEMTELDKKKAELTGKLLHITGEGYLPPFVQEFEEEKASFLSKLNAAKAEFEESREMMLSSRAEFSELASITALQPGLIVCAAYLHYLTSPKIKFPVSLTLEALEVLSKPFINNLTFNFTGLSKKLKKIQAEAVQFVDDIINFPLFSIYNNPKGQKQYKILARYIESISKYKKIIEEHQKLKQEWAKTKETLDDRVKTAISEASKELIHKKNGLIQEGNALESQVQILTKIKDNIEKKWKRILKMSQDLNQKNLKWIDEVKNLKVLRKNLSQDSVYIAIEIISAFKHPNPVRARILEIGAEIVAKRYPSFLGVPKFPSNTFSHFISIKTNGKVFKGVHVLDRLSYFESTIAGVKSVFKYSLPYPCIIDPYKIFTEFIYSSEEEIMNVTLEAGFENKLENLVSEGKAALVINPTPALFLALNSLIQCRNNYYLFRSRGLSTDNLEFRIANITIKFNPKFRFYVCIDNPNPIYQRNFTIFSMELEGNDWENMIFYKIQKHIDSEYAANREENYKNLYSHKDQTLFEEKEVVSKLQIEYNKENPLGFFEFLDDVWNSLFINDSEVPKHQKNYLKEENEIFNMDCPQLMDALHKVYYILNMVNSLIQPYDIPKRMFMEMVLDCVKDFYHNTNDINFSQLALNVEAIVYSLFTWIYSSMPTKQATLFAFAFTWSRFCELYPGLNKDSEALLKDVSNGIQMSPEAVFEYLKSNFPGSLTEDLTLDSISKLDSSELYRTVKLPKTYKFPVKLFIYSKLRIDLLPMILSEILTDVFGPRYSFLPSPTFHRFDLNCDAKRPIFILYDSNLPFKSIEEESNKFELKEPIIKVSLNEKRDMVQTNCKELEKTLKSEHRANNWLVIDKSNVINPNEIEFLTKSILNAIQNPRFRVFLILHGKIEDNPHLLPLFEISYRMYFKDANCVRDKFQDWMRWNLKDVRQKETCKKIELFKDHLTNNPNLYKSQRSKYKNKGKGVLRKDKNVRVFTNFLFNRVVMVQADDIVVDMPASLNYSIALFTAFSFIRCRYSKEVCLTYPDTYNVMEGVQSYLAKRKTSEQVPLARKIIEYFWPAELVTFFEMIVKSKTTNIELDIGLDKLKYPLFAAYKREEVEDLEDFIECMASEDHLKLFGLDNSIQKSKRISQGLFYSSHFPILYNEPLPVIQFDYAQLEQKIMSLKTLLPEKPQMKIDTKDPILEAFWLHEISDYENLLIEIRSNLTSICTFLTYSNSLILKEDSEVLSSLKYWKIPSAWKDSGPYCLKNIKDLDEWISRLSFILKSKLKNDLRVSFNPNRYFYLFIRNYKVTNIKLKAVKDPEGIRGLIIKNGKLVKGRLVGDTKDAEIGPFKVEVDHNSTIQDSYIYFGQGEKDSYVLLSIFECENFSALFNSSLSENTCKFNFMKVEISSDLYSIDNN